MRVAWSGLVWCLFVLGCATSAAASPLTPYAILRYITPQGTDVLNIDSAELASTPILGGGVFDEHGGAVATVESDGELRARAEYFGNSSTRVTYDGTAQYFDTISLLESEAYPLGTPVELAFALHLTINFPSSCSNTAGGAMLLLNDESVFPLFANAVVGDFVFGCTQAVDRLTATVAATIGDELLVRLYLSAIVSGLGPTPLSVDASNTASFSVTPIGDFTYSTASGNRYPAPVPEPSSIVLLGTGAISLVVRRRYWPKKARVANDRS